MTKDILSIPFNVAVRHISDKIFPCGFDVSEDAPKTYDELVAHYHKQARLSVWNGASDRTIFGCPETNYMFRAWHDSKHLLYDHPFTPDGERSVMLQQQADIGALYDGAQADYFCEILEAEIMGQLQYAEIHGDFPGDQIGFVRAYLADPLEAIEQDWS